MKTVEKIKKADALRKNSNTASKSLEKVTKDWDRETNKAKTPQQRKHVNEKYTELYAKADKQENKAYAKYYNFVHKNFQKSTIDKSLNGGNFVDKSFIDGLSRNVEQAHKTQVQATKKTTRKKK